MPARRASVSREAGAKVPVACAFVTVAIAVSVSVALRAAIGLVGELIAVPVAVTVPRTSLRTG